MYVRSSRARPPKPTQTTGNNTKEMEYIGSKIQKWMPPNQRVAVDSVPRLHGIFDTINSTLATPSAATHLPSEFYDTKAREIIDRITTEEEFSGYKESLEYRKLGIGALLGEVVERMVHSAYVTKHERPVRGDRQDPEFKSVKQDNQLRLALFGCHDSTIAAILASLGAFEGENSTWPSYTSSIAVELFADTEADHQSRIAKPNKQHTNKLKEVLQMSPLSSP